MNWSTAGLARVLRRHEIWLLQQAGVAGVGLNQDPEGKPCLEILTDSMLHVVRREIQRRLAGVPLQFVERESRPTSPGKDQAQTAGPDFWLARDGDRVRFAEDGSSQPLGPGTSP